MWHAEERRALERWDVTAVVFKGFKGRRKKKKVMNNFIQTTGTPSPFAVR